MRVQVGARCCCVCCQAPPTSCMGASQGGTRDAQAMTHAHASPPPQCPRVCCVDTAGCLEATSPPFFCSSQPSGRRWWTHWRASKTHPACGSSGSGSHPLARIASRRWWTHWRAFGPTQHVAGAAAASPGAHAPAPCRCTPAPVHSALASVNPPPPCHRTPPGDPPTHTLPSRAPLPCIPPPGACSFCLHVSPLHRCRYAPPPVV